MNLFCTFLKFFREKHHTNTDGLKTGLWFYQLWGFYDFGIQT